MHLTRGDLKFYEIGQEKSAEVIVPIGKRALKDQGGLTRMGRTER